MTGPYRSAVRAGRDGFARLLPAEWTKLVTVRGWVAGVALAALAVMLLGLLSAATSRSSCSQGTVEVPCPQAPVGPDGVSVSDDFFFVHRQLTGDGVITARVTAMTGRIKQPPPPGDPGPGPAPVPGVVPWAKAGLMVKESTRQGSAYVAVMVTGDHGVRLQHNFLHDTAGRPEGVSRRSPRWLRLVRTGDTLTGSESFDGRRWTETGTVRLAGLPGTVRVGLFAASPGDLTIERNPGGGNSPADRFAEVTATFDRVGLEGRVADGAWSRDDIGVTHEPDGVTPHHPGGVVESGGVFTVTGAGDVGPATGDAGMRIERMLQGTFLGMIALIVVGVLFITTEYQRGLIRTTMLASPRRGRVLAAKAVVIGSAAFMAGLAAAAVTVLAGRRILRAGGTPVYAVAPLTELRVVVGTAALFAVAAVFALALGALVRRGTVAVIVATGLLVLPYLLAITSFLPVELSRWLLRVTPAAGFAIQQSVPPYPHALGYHVPQAGYLPLPPWAGFAVLCCWAGFALGAAIMWTRRRDV